MNSFDARSNVAKLFWERKEERNVGWWPYEPSFTKVHQLYLCKHFIKYKHFEWCSVFHQMLFFISKQWMSWILNNVSLLCWTNLWIWSRFSIWVIDNADHSLDILCVCTLMVNSFIGWMKRDRRDPSIIQIFFIHVAKHQLFVNQPSRIFKMFVSFDHEWFCVEV